MRRVFVVAVLAGACGRIAFDPAAADSGAGADARAAGSDAGACTFGPWSTPQPLTAINLGTNNSSGQISGDGLTFYFARENLATGFLELEVATRASREDSLGALQAVSELDAPGGDNTDPSPAGDLLEMYFVRGSEIYVTTRTTTGDLWGTPVLQAQLDTTTGNALGPYLSPDGLTLFYSDNTDGNGEGDLFVTTRATRSAGFPGGTQLSLAIGAPIGYPALTGDTLTVYFDARTGTGSTTQLWQATRSPPAVTFQAAMPVPDIGVAGSDDTDASITADGLELYFASDRDMDQFQNYVATRACL